ncbi:DUF397 domain-containing protein [Streptomyces sp. NPDC048172]|uniref:DUF397 domain-containing protein n=1 Tax=Streptomyces sp. NPDC048172 TaxID=3365505 RepID=UPI003721775E
MDTIRGETRIRWRKSSYSADKSGDCVEVAAIRPRVAVRDSKNPQGPHLTFPASAFEAFIRDARR